MTTTIEDDQRREGVLRELFPDTEPVAVHTTYIDGDSSVHEYRGLEALRQFTEKQRLKGYEGLVAEARVSEPTTFEGVFRDIFDQAFELLVQRQHKYGPNNISQQGMWGVLTRIADDKVSRLRRAFNGAIENGQIFLDDIPEGDSDDTFEDACLDLMNYAAILLSLKRGTWGMPLEGGDST